VAVAGKKKSSGPRAPSLPRAAAEAVDQATQLLERRRPGDALKLLREVDRQFPNNFLVLQLLAEAAHDAGDDRLFLDVADRMASVSPDEPEVLAQRAYAHARMGWPFLAQRYFQQVAQRWPDTQVAQKSRETLATLESAIATTTQQMEQQGHAAADAPELGARHEQVQVWLARGKYADARRVAQQLLSKWPKFAPALNNVAEAWAREGNLAQAVAATRQALAAVPDNAFAQASLVRLLMFDDRRDEAREAAAKLMTVPVPHPEARLRMAEALSMLGDHEAVLKVWASAEQEGFRLADVHLAYLHHLAAVAAYRGGEEKRARELWARCLRAAPNFTPASASIDDLDQPVGRQNGPWPCPLDVLLAPATLDEITHRFRDAPPVALEAKTRDEARRYLQQNPQVLTTLPLLLEKGDPIGRGLAVTLASNARTPQTLAVLRAFALSQNGMDRHRIQAAQALGGTEQSLGGEARLWLRGEWRAFRLFDAVISNDATEKKPPARFERLLAEASRKVSERDDVQAEALYRQALKEMPDSPSARYNLAQVLSRLGRQTESEALMREVAARNPDYLFGILHQARERAGEGDPDGAERMLDAIPPRPVLHQTEFAALVLARIELARLRLHPEAARDWYLLLEAVQPDNPNLRVVAGWVGEG
jgi:tetratricopeptide (TPR) repeat protein